MKVNGKRPSRRNAGTPECDSRSLLEISGRNHWDDDIRWYRYRYIYIYIYMITHTIYRSYMYIIYIHIYIYILYHICTYTCIYIYILLLYNMLYTYAIHRKEAGQRLLQTCVEKFARLTSLVLDKHLERLSPRNIVHSWIKDLRHGGKKRTWTRIQTEW